MNRQARPGRRTRRLDRSLPVIAVICVLGASAALPRGATRLRADDAGERPSRNDRNLERWKRLDEDERARLRELHRRLQEMDREKRERLIARLKAMRPDEREAVLRELRRRFESLEPEERREAIARARAARTHRMVIEDVERFRHRHCIPPPVRERVEELPPEQQKSFIHRYVEEREEKFRRRRQELLAELPASLRGTVASYPPRDQALFLRRYLANKLLHTTFPDPQEREQILEVPVRELHEILRRAPAQRPQFFRSEASWERWNALKPYERGRLIHHIFHLRNEDGNGPSGCRFNRHDRHRRPPGDRQAPEWDRRGKWPQALPQLRSRPPSASSRNARSTPDRPPREEPSHREE